jgi:hypothetical protein
MKMRGGMPASRGTIYYLDVLDNVRFLRGGEPGRGT